MKRPGTVATALLNTLKDGKEQGIAAIEKRLGFNRRQISDAAGQLRYRGFLAPTQPGFYKLSDGGVAAIKNKRTISSGPIGPTGAVRFTDNSFRGRAWRAIRVRRQFTLSDIVGDAVRSESQARSNLARYLRILIAIGYVAEIPRRQRGTRVTSNGFKKYRLIKNTGPHAPAYSFKRKIVRDRNTGKDIPCAPKC